MGQVFFQNTILNSYGPLLKYLPLTLVDRSHDGNAQGAPTTADAPESVPSSSDVKVVDYGHAAGPNREPDEVASSHPHGADDKDEERMETSSFTDESHTSAPPSKRPMEDEGPTDFSHPAAVEKQRIIWLPTDPLGLIREIEEDLASQDILYSTEGAEMNSKGRVDVTLAPPEIRRVLMVADPSPSPDVGQGDQIRSLG